MILWKKSAGFVLKEYLPYIHCWIPRGKDSILTKHEAYISLKPKQIDIFFFSLTENVQSWGEKTIHVNTTKLLLIPTAAHKPLSLRPLCTKGEASACQGEEGSRDLAPSSISFSQGCGALFTSRTKRDAAKGHDAPFSSFVLFVSLTFFSSFLLPLQSKWFVFLYQGLKTYIYQI